MPTEIIFVYVPCASVEEAKKIARTLVEEKLAACANILGPSHAIYTWEGALEEAAEIPLLLKTRRSLFEKMQARVGALHSYKTPCIAAFGIDAINDSFAGWILRQTHAD